MFPRWIGSLCALRCPEPRTHRTRSRPVAVALDTVLNMNTGGLGTTITFVLAALLWFFYLVPSLRRKREYEATERNATRLAQTLRVLSQTVETPHEVVADLTSREVRARQRELQRIERERELRVRSEVRGYNVGIAQRRRRTKLSATIVGLTSIVTGTVLAVQGLWVGVVVAAVFTGLALAALVALNRTAHVVRASAPESNWEQFAEETGRWTPNRMPPVRTPAERQPAGAGLIVTAQVEADVAAKAAAEAIARQAAAAALAAAAAQPNPAAVDDRFAAMPPIGERELQADTVLDISAALRARRSS